MKPVNTLIVGTGLLAMSCVFSSAAYAASNPCGDPFHNHFGPYDYRTATQEQKNIVEKHHFLPQVESLTRGISGPLGQEISYTLEVFPNHPRALLAMAKLAEKVKAPKPEGATQTLECWFDRAIRFTPEDSNVRMVFGVVLLRQGLKDKAIQQLELAARLGSESANLHYNLGLAFFDLGQHDKALAHAHKAYAMGWDLPGLKGKLAKAGKWRDPVAAKPSEGEVSGAGAAAAAAPNDDKPSAPK